MICTPFLHMFTYILNQFLNSSERELKYMGIDRLLIQGVSNEIYLAIF